ncbi:MAG TPA: hypothetical protein VJ753_00815 [Rhizomicrobium sp.]|nr:hypothetical protein [Rhizomicrobium sp.]
MTVAFNLLENATDSLRHAVEIMAQHGARKDHASLKHAITNSAHCVELLLKERLRRINPAFVWEKVDQYPSLDARTVTVDTAIARLRKIGGVTISTEEERTLKSLRNTRNAIAHYEWHTNEKEAREIFGHALSFAFDFSRRELGVELSNRFKDDDTWAMLCDESYEFSHIYAARIAERLHAEGQHPQSCDNCGEHTISFLGGSCELCGHWQSLEIDED